MDQHQAHICPRPSRGLLPWKIIQHIAAGRIQEVCDWISEGGDINAADNIDQTLLHHACQEEQVEMVKKLLEFPDIHLNTRSNTKEGFTPLGVATGQGYLEIVEILLKSQQSKCVIDPAICFGSGGVRNNRITAIITAAHGRHWPTVKLLLKYYNNMRESEGYHILSKSIENYEYDIANDVIRQNNTYQDHDFGCFIQEVYRSQQWELLEAIIRKNVLYKNDSSKKLFYLIVLEKDWSNLERFLRLINNGQIKIHVSLAEAVVERRVEEAKKLLEQVKDDKEVMAGTLLTAVIAGTSEDIADLLINEVPAKYSDETLNNALIIGALSNRLEFMTHLLKKKVFSYQVMSRSRMLALSQNKYDANTLLQKALEERLKEYTNGQKTTEDVKTVKED